MENQLSTIGWKEIAIGAVFVLVTAASAIKAFHEIRKRGWAPFAAKYLQPLRSRREKIDAMIDSMETMQTTLSGIAGELRTNGGTSLKDMVVGIDEKVERIQARARHQDETSPIAQFEMNTEGQMVSVNFAFREMVNCEENDLMFRNYLSRVHREDRARLKHEIEEAIDNKMPFDSTVCFRLDESTVADIRLQGSPDVRHDGDLKGFFGTATIASTRIHTTANPDG